MDYLTWLNDHWMVLVGVFYVLEKAVKLSPWPYDDILIDMIWGGIKASLGRKQA